MEQASGNARVQETPQQGVARRLLRLEGATFSGVRGTELGPLTFDVMSGETVALVGPASAGAVTLLRATAGLSAPDTGLISLQDSQPHPGHPGVGIAFRDPLLFEWRDALQNVLLQAEIRGLNRTASTTRARELLASMGLAGAESRKPAELSNGDAQRVSICRALLHQPAILLLEEPFHGLDAVEREQLAYDLERITRESRAAVLLATSQTSEAALISDRVAVLAGSPATIRAWFEIPLPRPRRWDREQTPRLTEVVGAVRTLLQAHGALA